MRSVWQMAQHFGWRVCGVVGIALCLSSTALANPPGPMPPPPSAQEFGVIQELSFGTNEMVVRGVKYKVSPSVVVEIGGTYGAFTMLSPGMKVSFEANETIDGVLQVQDIRQVMPGENPEDS